MIFIICPWVDLPAKATNLEWLTDITELQILAVKMCLSLILGCFEGMVINWSIGTQPDADLVNANLHGAIETVTN
jgi:transposase InsO family protein